MEELKAKICACEDPKCVKALATKDVKQGLMKALANSSDADKKTFLKIGKAADACVARIEKNAAAKGEATADSKKDGAAKKTPNKAGSGTDKKAQEAKEAKKQGDPKGTAKKAPKVEVQVKKIELPALVFHVERHKQKCACKKLTGSVLGTCLANVKSWEGKHTIKKVAEKPTPQELKARGQKILEAKSKIPCEGPAGKTNTPVDAKTKTGK